ncbi:MAG: hypothetical protein KAW67_10470, partial [Candidatus Eisenbacteria sp.]|nr:hypothetical protein [Candidatus Eisenbacteria bacterium]
MKTTVVTPGTDPSPGDCSELKRGDATHPLKTPGSNMEFIAMLKRTLCVLLAVAAVFALAATATAKTTVAAHTENVDLPNSRSPIVLFFDDMESGVAGWTSADNTATSTPHFHLDTYMAYEGTYSWW